MIAPGRAPRAGRAPLLLSLVLAPLLAVPAGGRARAAGGSGEPTLLVTSRPGGRILVEAGMEIDAPPEEVRAVVTDYDRLSEYIPKMDLSRVESRQGGRVVVRQEGTTRFIFRKRIKLTLEFREESPGTVAFRLLEGSFDEFEGTWRFLPASRPGATLLQYRVLIRSGLHVPSALIRRVIRRDMDQMMPAIAKEVGRRRRAAAEGTR